MMDCKVHEVKENHLTLLFGGRKTHICKRFERETDLLVGYFQSLCGALHRGLYDTMLDYWDDDRMCQRCVSIHT